MRYTGVLRHKEMPAPVRTGYRIWCNQRQRCYNRDNPDWERFGGRGAKVHYDASEFLGWWVQEMEKADYKNPCVVRIDRAGNFEFGNILIVEKNEHIAKMNTGRKIRKP